MNSPNVCGELASSCVTSVGALNGPARRQADEGGDCRADALDRA